MLLICANILRANIGLRSERRPFLFILIQLQALHLAGHLYLLGASLSGLSGWSLAVRKHRPIEAIEILESILNWLVLLLLGVIDRGRLMPALLSHFVRAFLGWHIAII